MKRQSKFNETDKKEMRRTLLRRLIILALMFGSFGAAFGLSELLKLIQACITLIVGVIIIVYPCLFGYMAYRQSFGKAWDNLNPGIYIKMIVLMALFDLEPEDII